jgi:AcrR family transcriptional regulator
MSMNEGPKGVDRRAWRTRQLLAQALIDLGAEHGVDCVGVRDLVDCAGVARSTFYTHYASKEDFLTGSFVNLINMAEMKLAEVYPRRSDLLPSRPLFEHIHQSKAFATRVPQSREYRQMMASGETRLRDIVMANIARLKPDWPASQRRETAVFVAAGFIGLIRWWMEDGVRRTPDEMQAAFHRLTQSALELSAPLDNLQD